MSKQLQAVVKGHSIAQLIRKHGGWLDDNDKDVVRFPSTDKCLRFLADVDKAREVEKRHRHG